MARPKRTCSIEGCARKPHSRSWCRVHYDRWLRLGDPLAGGTFRGQPGQYFREVVLAHQGRDCLIWPFARTGDGYAQVHLDGRMQRVGRLVCERVYGSAPTPRHEAAHSCGQGHLGCVSPLHLRWATTLENQADMLRHGTRAKGERVGSAKLTARDVRDIRALSGRLLQREIAERFGISAPHVSKLLNKKKWNWLE